MKRNVILEIPFKGGKFATIKLPEPCIYCGKPVNEDGFIWKGSLVYSLMKWGISKKFGDHQVYEQKINGQIQKGTVRVEAPYCAEHTEGVKTYRIIKLIFSLLGLLAGIVGIIFYWPARSGDLMDVVAIVMFLFLGFSIGFLVSMVVNKILPLFPGINGDFPALNQGHWGFTIEGVTVDKGELGVGPINYYLQIVFLDIESAKRTMEAYPGSRVVQGQNLIEN